MPSIQASFGLFSSVNFNEHVSRAPDPEGSLSADEDPATATAASTTVVEPPCVVGPQRLVLGWPSPRSAWLSVSISCTTQVPHPSVGASDRPFLQ